ncbi:endolytic transglycosylase MltG [Alphaproteobacteria bacterium]|nr:endolytic transglycosylase MltG [Alphaproteobacteria bacterium]
MNRSFKFFILSCTLASIFFYLIASLLNSIFYKPLVKYDKFIIIKKNINENAFLDYLNQNKIKVSKLQWHVSKFFTKDKFLLKHGEFIITKSNSLIDLLENINNNIVHYRKFTLIEGTNSQELKNRLIQTPGLVGKVPYLSEGKFKPDTYLYKWGDSKASLLQKMEIEQNKIIETHWQNRKKNRFIKSKFDVLILASIIEKEGKKSEELKNISSVFLNRLNKNMKLQSDVTVAYALNKKGNNLKRLDLKSKNYFNTYRYRGLPPTPISYPGEKAILAVLYPNKTDYLYFVSDGKGGHRFSKNFSEHKKNIKLWIKDLKKNGKN